MNNQIIRFWRKQINILSWYKKPKKIFTLKKNNYFNWFEDGKLNLHTTVCKEILIMGWAKKLLLFSMIKNTKKVFIPIMIFLN